MKKLGAKVIGKAFLEGLVRGFVLVCVERQTEVIVDNIVKKFKERNAGAEVELEEEVFVEE